MAKARGGHCIAKAYDRSNVKMPWRCAENHQWEATASSVQQGSWCPVCAGTVLLGMPAMRAMAAGRGGECVSARYVNIWTPLLWRCAEGHEWKAVPEKVRHHGTWCPFCARRSSKTLEDLQALAGPFGGTCLARRVTTIHDHYRWRCRLGHVFTASAHDVQQGHWCRRCRGRVQDDLARMRRLARRRGGECLASEYVNATTKLWWRCRDGHEWDALPGSIVQGTWCPVCGHAGSSTAPLSIEVMQEIAVKRGGLCLSTRYTNLRSRLRWRCALGHDWVASAANVRHGGSWCPTCAHSVPGTIDGMRRLAVERGGRCLSEEYVGQRTMLRWECSAGHRFEARGVAVKSGVWCPSCRQRQRGRYPPASLPTTPNA
jgi:hypothetical protein